MPNPFVYRFASTPSGFKFVAQYKPSAFPGFRDEPHKMFHKPGDAQFLDGPGGFIYFDSGAGKLEQIKNILTMGIHKYLSDKGIEKELNEILRFVANITRAEVGYYVSKPGDESIKDSGLLSGKRVLSVLNIPKDLLFVIARQIERRMGGQVYVRPLNERETLYEISGMGEPKPVTMKDTSYGHGGDNPSTKEAMIIMSVDSNDAHAPQSLSPQEIKTSLSAWVGTQYNRHTYKDRIDNVVDDMNPFRKIKFNIRPMGRGGYMDGNKFHNEHSFVIKISNINEENLETLGRALADEFSQCSVVVIFKDSNGKVVSGLIS